MHSFHYVKNSVYMYVTCKMFMRISVKGNKFHTVFVVTVVTTDFYAPGEALYAKKFVEKQIL